MGFIETNVRVDPIWSDLSAVPRYRRIDRFRIYPWSLTPILRRDLLHAVNYTYYLIHRRTLATRDIIRTCVASWIADLVFSQAPLSTKLRRFDIGLGRGNRGPHRPYSNLRESNLTFDSHIRTGNFTLAIPRNQPSSLEFTSGCAHLAHPFPFHRANALAKSATCVALAIAKNRDHSSASRRECTEAR